MRLHLRSVLSSLVHRFQAAVRSRPRLALAALALAAVVAVAGPALLERHAGPVRSQDRLESQIPDETAYRARSIAPSRMLMPASQPSVNAAEAVSGGWGRRVARRASLDVELGDVDSGDLEARIRNFERHEAQLLSFMGKAQKVQDLLSLESELARVRGEIEQATSRLRFLKARTDLATIQAALVRSPLFAPPDGLVDRIVEQVKQALVEGWSTAFAVALGAAAAAARLSPLAVAALAGWLIFRRWVRASRQGA